MDEGIEGRAVAARHPADQSPILGVSCGWQLALHRLHLSRKGITSFGTGAKNHPPPFRDALLFTHPLWWATECRRRRAFAAISGPGKPQCLTYPSPYPSRLPESYPSRLAPATGYGLPESGAQAPEAVPQIALWRQGADGGDGSGPEADDGSERKEQGPRP